MWLRSQELSPLVPFHFCLQNCYAASTNEIPSVTGHLYERQKSSYLVFLSRFLRRNCVWPTSFPFTVSSTHLSCLFDGLLPTLHLYCFRPTSAPHTPSFDLRHAPPLFAAEPPLPNDCWIRTTTLDKHLHHAPPLFSTHLFRLPTHLAYVLVSTECN